MTVKFMTVKGPDRLARAPVYLGIPQHERTMPATYAEGRATPRRGRARPLSIGVRGGYAHAVAAMSTKTVVDRLLVAPQRGNIRIDGSAFKRQPEKALVRL